MLICKGPLLSKYQNNGIDLLTLILVGLLWQGCSNNSCDLHIKAHWQLLFLMANYWHTWSYPLLASLICSSLLTTLKINKGFVMSSVFQLSLSPYHGGLAFWGASEKTMFHRWKSYTGLKPHISSLDFSLRSSLSFLNAPKSYQFT